MEEKKIRLKKLIEHWAEHNDEHSLRFKEFAKSLADMGILSSADELNAAAEASRKVSKHLRLALEKWKV